jgi:hypothetical protein
VSETLTFELTVSDGTQSGTDQIVVNVVTPPTDFSNVCGAPGTSGSPFFVALAALAVGIFLRRSGGRTVS